MSATILIIEDDVAFARMLESFLLKQGYHIKVAYSIKEGKTIIESGHVDLILLDYRLPDGTGLDLMTSLRASLAGVSVIIMTSFHDIRTAVRAMRTGAFDYITKPVNPDEILMIIGDALRKKEHLHEPVSIDDGYTFIEGNSPASVQLHEYIRLVAPTDMSVIIQGESGTGKEYVARNIHKLSKRKNKPFVAIDCGAISSELAASELFGHVKGAFTGAVQNKTGQFEYANGGTLFLDEIGNLSYEVQVKLLRALQERIIQPIGSNKQMKVDVRIIAATNDDLQKSIHNGQFREDLYHRLNEFSIKTLSLRNRLVDMALFIDHFTRLTNKELGRNITAVSPEVLAIFNSYDWPGNLRELKNVIKRAVLLSTSEIIELKVLPEEMVREIDNNTKPNPGSDLKAVQELNERELIEKTLKEVKYNKTKAAQLLNIDRKTLYNKLEKYNLDK
jgi:two-component system response regulator HydG